MEKLISVERLDTQRALGIRMQDNLYEQNTFRTDINRNLDTKHLERYGPTSQYQNPIRSAPSTEVKEILRNDPSENITDSMYNVAKFAERTKNMRDMAQERNAEEVENAFIESIFGQSGLKILQDSKKYALKGKYSKTQECLQRFLNKFESMTNPDGIDILQNVRQKIREVESFDDIDGNTETAATVSDTKVDTKLSGLESQVSKITRIRSSGTKKEKVVHKKDSNGTKKEKAVEKKDSNGTKKEKVVEKKEKNAMPKNKEKTTPALQGTTRVKKIVSPPGVSNKQHVISSQENPLQKSSSPFTYKEPGVYLSFKSGKVTFMKKGTRQELPINLSDPLLNIEMVESGNVNIYSGKNKKIHIMTIEGSEIKLRKIKVDIQPGITKNIDSKNMVLTNGGWLWEKTLVLECSYEYEKKSGFKKKFKRYLKPAYMQFGGVIFTIIFFIFCLYVTTPKQISKNILTNAF